MTVKHEITDRPVEDLSKPALVAEWNEAYEQLQSGTALDRDSVWDRRQDLWMEMRNRTDAEPPECPECGGDRWKQSMGGPKHCSDCGLALGEDHADLIQEIDSYWSFVQSADAVSTDDDLDPDTKDVLISASSSDIAHKRVTNLSSHEEAFWRVSGTPQQTGPGRRVWFVDRDTIHAYGEITALEDGRLWFDGAHETYLPCLDDAPTRGFCYIEPLIPRLDDTDWSVTDAGEFVVEGGEA